MFRRNISATFTKHFAVLFLVECSIDDDACANAKEDTDPNGDKGQPSLRDCEVVRCVLEDIWDGSEEQEKDAECE
jgi:hypothetical protein